MIIVLILSSSVGKERLKLFKTSALKSSKELDEDALGDLERVSRPIEE